MRGVTRRCSKPSFGKVQVRPMGSKAVEGPPETLESGAKFAVRSVANSRRALRPRPFAPSHGPRGSGSPNHVRQIHVGVGGPTGELRPDADHVQARDRRAGHRYDC